MFESGDHRIRKIWFSKNGLTILNKRLMLVKKRFNITTIREMVQLCLKYSLSRDNNLCVIVGFKNKKQINDSLSTKGHISEKNINFIRNIFVDINEEIGTFTDFKKEKNV